MDLNKKKKIMGVIHVEKCISPVFRLYCNVLTVLRVLNVCLQDMKNVSCVCAFFHNSDSLMIFGYCSFCISELAFRNTFTVQVDCNICHWTGG